MTVLYRPQQTGGASTPNLIPLLVAVAAVSPLAINMYLPSTPGMAKAFDVEFSTIQLTLSIYFAILALGQLFVGPISDRFGRRPVLLSGLSVFVAGSLLCLVATNISILILGRVLQAAGGCTGITMSRAIVRDVYGNDRVASAIAYVTMGMAVAPMVAPTAGGILDASYGWQGSFAFLAAFGLISLLITYRSLPETNDGRGRTETPRRFRTDVAVLMQSRQFWGYTLTTSLISGVFFAFLAGAPYVVIEIMRRSPTEYGLYFPLAAAGYICGNFITGRLATRLGSDRMITAGILVELGSVAAIALFFWYGFVHPLSLFGPMFFIGAGSGLVVPSGVAGAVSARPDVAGTAAGLTGSVQMGLGALLAPIVGAVLGSTVWPLIAIMGACAVMSVPAFALVGASPTRPERG